MEPRINTNGHEYGFAATLSLPKACKHLKASYAGLCSKQASVQDRHISHLRHLRLCVLRTLAKPTSRWSLDGGFEVNLDYV